MVPERLLQFAVAGREALPRYLTPEDHAWLRVLLEEFQRFEGRKVDRLRQRLEEPLRCYTPEGKAKLAIHVLERLCGNTRPPAPVSPKRARSALFCAAQRVRDRGDPWDREMVVASAASGLGASTDALLESLFADLPRERLVSLPSPLPEPHDLALRANLALAQGFLQRSSRVVLAIDGNARPVVRQVLLRRLLCTVRPPTGRGRATIEISGPYSLFKRTILYGRALASLVPVLQACDRFDLTADGVLRGRALSVSLRSGDPIFPSAAVSRRYDSKLEERFAREFRREAPEYDLAREPEPVRAGDHLIFPDFAIWHRRDPRRRVLLEIIGFWTPAYLRKKIERLRLARPVDMVLCIDDSLNCTDDALADVGPVVRYRRSIDVKAVLVLIERMLDQRAQPGPSGEPGSRAQ